VAAIGPGTAAALAERGIVADVLPERFVAEGLVQALAQVPVRRALVARASQARDVLPEALRARGAVVDVLALYDTVVEPLPAPVLAQARGADYITFTSSSTVRFFMEAAAAAAGEGPGGTPGDGQPPNQATQLPADRGARLSPHTRIVSIGPVTSEALQAYGLSPHVEASQHDIEGLVEALVEDVTAREH
jgi:uroporphyrinogen III methyltransferase/synthase